MHPRKGRNHQMNSPLAISLTIHTMLDTMFQIVMDWIVSFRSKVESDWTVESTQKILKKK
jgi:hypothetical protein